MNLAATLTAIIALIGYFLMRFFLPTSNYERILFLGSVALIAVFLMFMHRRKKRKKEATT
jgi:membrane protein DedA with SNARE-associated domain